MSNLLARIITALILLPVVIMSFVLGGVVLKILLGLVGVVCCAEVANIISPSSKRAQLFAVLMGLCFFLPGVLEGGALWAIASLFIACFIFNGMVLFSPHVDKNQFEKLSAIFFWCLYITFAVLCLYWLIQLPEGLAFVCCACIATWASDTFAYFGGRLFGKHSLFPSVSAKKTWEGFFSGAVVSVAGIFLFGNFFAGLTTVDLFFVALPVCVLAPVGDLMESRLKRLYDTKDASNILPGHGGLLDRVDALLLTLPWTAFYAFIIRPVW